MPDSANAYHQRTKHHLQGYAAGPNGLDWANQPDPFRRFADTPQLALPLYATDTTPAYDDLYRTGQIPPQPLNRINIATCLQLSMGLSAWKQYGENRWALRCNPSSGNLHPTEAYVVTSGNAELPAGVYHYNSHDHGLEQRCQFEANTPPLPTDTLLIGLSSIPWREAWKYGERAYRYCQHDVGHAIAALRYAAAALGWQLNLLDTWSDDQVAHTLGLDRDNDFANAEREHPDVMLQLNAQPSAAEPINPDSLSTALTQGHWQGHANKLSATHGHHWPIIDAVSKRCHKPEQRPANRWLPKTLPPPLETACRQSAATLFQQRRSAQAFDGHTTLACETFWRMLDLTLPRPKTPPFDSLQNPPRIHLLFFIHRVTGLAPGLYLFLRDEDAKSQVQNAMGRDFDWQPVTEAPTHLPLFRLHTADAREASKILSCHQDIAADGAFSLGMLSDYANTLASGDWQYRALFWEAGMIGQTLYLEAEAAGLRGTGIGCYFDDGVHDLLGLHDETLQSLYHFTVGGALTDERLQTLPPYAHLAQRE